MKFLQMTKRVALFLIVNLLVMLTITFLLSLFGVNRYFPQGGYGSLMIFCFVWGMAGAFISLGLSRIMAKWMMGVQVIPPDTNQPALRELVETVHNLARRAGLTTMPEVGLFVRGALGHCQGRGMVDGQTVHRKQLCRSPRSAE